MEIVIKRLPHGWRYEASQGEAFAAFSFAHSFKDAWVNAHLTVPAGGDVSALL